jgi:Tol biopolymer transport system component
MAGLCALAVIAGITLPGRSADAAFPGANGKIAFDTPLPGGPGFNPRQIDTVNPDGSGRALLTGAPVDDSEPAWSPNGLRIVYTCRDANETEICVINADGSGAMVLTDRTDANTPANDDASPAFSGDGSWVVFSRNDGPPQFDTEIWMMAADGSNETKLTTNAISDTEPTVSPDSLRIAFTRSIPVPGTSADVIFTMAPNGTGELQFTPSDGTMTAEGPNFSPDGTRLTFARCDDFGEGCNSSFQIVTMSSTAPLGPQTELTDQNNFGDDDLDPVFSPDGTRIAFARTINFQASDIFTVSAAGGPVQPLTATGAEGNPDWQPIAVPATPSGGGTAGAGDRGKLCRKVPTTIVGTKGKDFIVGTAGRDVVHGLKGRDRIYGLQGHDRLCGGRGFDKIFGDEGSDYLFGGDNHDFLSGGPGVDFLFGGTPSAPVKLIDDTCHRDAGGGKLRNCQKTD